MFANKIKDAILFVVFRRNLNTLVACIKYFSSKIDDKDWSEPDKTRKNWCISAETLFITIILLQNAMIWQREGFNACYPLPGGLSCCLLYGGGSVVDLLFYVRVKHK